MLLDTMKSSKSKLELYLKSNILNTHLSKETKWTNNCNTISFYMEEKESGDTNSKEPTSTKTAPQERNRKQNEDGNNLITSTKRHTEEQHEDKGHRFKAKNTKPTSEQRTQLIKQFIIQKQTGEISKHLIHIKHNSRG